MSSLRCKRNKCQHVTQHENKTFKGGSRSNRYTQGLLRLDSTGEVTSAQNVSNCQSPSFKHGDLNSKDNQRLKQTCYNSFVDNLRMGSLINSASAYIGSATSYFGNLCPYKTAKGLTRSNSDNSSFGYLKNMLSGASQPRLNNSNSVPGIDTELDCLKHSCKCAESKLSEEIEKSMSWTGNIFGALHCSLLSNCPVSSDKMKGVNVEKYVPPQRRYTPENASNISSVINPKLTPYNAKLLEKSKRFQSHSNLKKDFLAKAHHQQVPKTNEVKPEHNIGKQCEEKVIQHCPPVQETVLDCNLDPAKPGKHEIKSDEVIKSDQTETTNSKCETDWFDYECDNAKCIPLSIEKIQLAAQKCVENDDSQQLHSWFSIENGNEAANTDSSLATDAANLCDKTINCSAKESIQPAEKPLEDNGKCAETQNSQKNENERLASISTRCKSKLENKYETDHSMADSNNYVLYVRSLGRRGRPSAKKRRRQKAQQNENNEHAQASSDKSSSVLKPSSAVHPGSAVAFILGYGADRAENETHSFHVSCDIEGDSDWSDSDFESDENLSSVEDESMFGNGLGFQCNDPLMQCFTLTCTVQPSEDSSLSPDSSAIDNINLSWRVQVSIEPESPKKKSSTSKKVRFADDNDLITVHPMITWSHAYQAARKGPWEQFARDRGRFLRKITDGETLLKPVLQKDHRDKIFRERFSGE